MKSSRKRKKIKFRKTELKNVSELERKIGLKTIQEVEEDRTYALTN